MTKPKKGKKNLKKVLTLKYPGDIFVFVADAAAKHKALQMQHWSGFHSISHHSTTSFHANS